MESSSCQRMAGLCSIMYSEPLGKPTGMPHKPFHRNPRLHPLGPNKGSALDPVRATLAASKPLTIFAVVSCCRTLIRNLPMRPSRWSIRSGTDSRQDYASHEDSVGSECRSSHVVSIHAASIEEVRTAHAQIVEEVRGSPLVKIDETGWKVNGLGTGCMCSSPTERCSIGWTANAVMRCPQKFWGWTMMAPWCTTVCQLAKAFSGSDSSAVQLSSADSMPRASGDREGRRCEFSSAGEEPVKSLLLQGLSIRDRFLRRGSRNGVGQFCEASYWCRLKKC